MYKFKKLIKKCRIYKVCKVFLIYSILKLPRIYLDMRGRVAPVMNTKIFTRKAEKEWEIRT